MILICAFFVLLVAMHLQSTGLGILMQLSASFPHKQLEPWILHTEEKKPPKSWIVGFFSATDRFFT